MFGEETPGVVDAPYSAVGTTETITTFVDGNRVVRTESVRFFRDSQGRSRLERTLMSVPLPEDSRPELVRSRAEPVHVVITDPMRGENYMVDTRSKTFQRMLFPTRASAPIHPPLEPPLPYMLLQFGNVGRAFPPDPYAVEKTVSLGEKTIEGVTAVGSRLERTIQPGDMGNQRPITISAEQWFSRELGVIVLSTQHSSIGLDTTYRLQQIVRYEPDPALFAIPSDYTQREMSSTMTAVKKP
jgi:hypothetical protein